ncbi:MAG: ABC transporter ATP-binding protein [Pseudomonadota bacterium]
MSGHSSAVDAALSCVDLSIAIAERTLVAKLSLTLPQASWLAVLGKNGAGKSLTLATLAGLLPATPASIQLQQRELHTMTAGERARSVTLVTQTQDDAFENSVWENVLLGRYPHLGKFERPGDNDHALAAFVLSELGMDGFEAREVRTLSGGERQRIAIAQSLVQQTPLLLLDEPVSQLDPNHARLVLALLAERQRTGQTIVSSLHDVNAAARYATHVLLLYGDGRWAFDEAGQLLTTHHLSELYGTPFKQVGEDSQRLFVATY